jgi:hypothetical protein
MGARDYVKPVSSHEAVFVGSTNLPNGTIKSRSSIRKEELEYCRPPVWNEPEVRINIVYNIVASTDLKSGY